MGVCCYYGSLSNPDMFWYSLNSRKPHCCESSNGYYGAPGLDNDCCGDGWCIDIWTCCGNECCDPDTKSCSGDSIQNYHCSDKTDLGLALGLGLAALALLIFLIMFFHYKKKGKICKNKKKDNP